MCDHVARTVSTYDAIAKDYGLTALPAMRAWERDSMRFFQSSLPGRSVLVPACGDGRDSRDLRSLGLAVDSFDLSESMLAIAKSRDPCGKYWKLDLRHIRSLSNRYDGVYASGCLYHLTKPEFVRCLRDIHRLLHDRGVLYLNLKEGTGAGFRHRPGPNYPGGELARTVLQGERFYTYYGLPEMRSAIRDFAILKERKLRAHGERVREFWLQKH